MKNAPRQVWATYAAGRYLQMRPEDVATHLASRGLSIRLGAYGDPAAMPIDVLERLSCGIEHTGYTHAWTTCDPDLRRLLMASADTAAERAHALELGWRVFRVRANTDPLEAREIACPASDEAGRRSACSRCNLCSGLASHTDIRAHIAIVVHGIGTGAFLKMLPA